MQLLLFSDLHLDTPLEWASPAFARKRRQAQRDTLARLVDLAVATRADAVLCGGDLYEHDRVSPDTAAFLQATFAKLHPIPLYIAPGNHDWYGPESLYRLVHWSSNVHVFCTDRLQPVALADGVTLWGAAHCAPANTDGFLDGFRVDRGGVHLALFHGSERGALTAQGTGKVPHAPFDAEQIDRAGLHHAFLGHYHQPRDAARHTYPGNPEPLAFGENGERGAVIATVAANGSIIRERRRLARMGVHDVEIDISECRSLQDVRAGIAGRLQGRAGCARVTLCGELHRDIALDLASLTDAASGIEELVLRVGALRPGYDLDTLAAEQTVRGQFVRDVLAENLADDVQRRVLITGLRALDGRDDLEVI